MNQILIDLIAEAVLNEVNNMGVLNITNKRVKVGVSARHVHLSKEDLDKLFGENYKLNVKKSLMGDQFAAEETVTIIGDKLKAIENVRILGPTRSKTQVEISLTDSIYLGVTAPIRLSGDIEKTAEITIVGPKGVVRKSEGCIVAKRHIHMSTLDSKKLGIKEGVISVKFNGERDGILNNIDVRISDEYHLELHIDTDEANALGIKNGEYVEILS